MYINRKQEEPAKLPEKPKNKTKRTDQNWKQK